MWRRAGLATSRSDSTIVSLNLALLRTNKSRGRPTRPSHKMKGQTRQRTEALIMRTDIAARARLTVQSWCAIVQRQIPFSIFKETRTTSARSRYDPPNPPIARANDPWQHGSLPAVRPLAPQASQPTTPEAAKPLCYGVCWGGGGALLLWTGFDC